MAVTPENFINVPWCKNTGMLTGLISAMDREAELQWHIPYNAEH